MADGSVILTSLSQVMQIFPEPALEEFEIENEKIYGYILHESDIVRGLVNYAYASVPRTDTLINLQGYLDAGAFTNFIWNPDRIHGIPSLVMNFGSDFSFDATTRIITLTPAFEVKAISSWNSVVTGTTLQIHTIIQAGVPIEFTVVGGALDGTRQRAVIYDSGVFNDVSQEYFLRNMDLVDPFIQRMCAILTVLDIIKFWIKPLYHIDNSANIAGTQFSEKEALPGWDHMQKRLEAAFKEMMDAVNKWGISRKGRVGDGLGQTPVDPSRLRNVYIGSAVRGTSTDSPTEYSPYLGWDDPFLFERPDRTNAVGDAIFGYTQKTPSSYVNAHSSSNSFSNW